MSLRRLWGFESISVMKYYWHCMGGKTSLAMQISTVLSLFISSEKLIVFTVNEYENMYTAGRNHRPEYVTERRLRGNHVLPESTFLNFFHFA